MEIMDKMCKNWFSHQLIDLLALIKHLLIRIESNYW